MKDSKVLWPFSCILLATAAKILGKPARGADMQDKGESNARSGSLGRMGHDLFGERRLWLAVVMQAVEEWRAGTLRNQRLAQRFLFDDSNDFHAVCANAGLDPDNLRSKLLKIGRKMSPTGRLAHPIAA